VRAEQCDAAGLPCGRRVRLAKLLKMLVGEVGERISFDSRALAEGEGKKAPIDGQGTISGAALTRKQRDGGAMTSTIKISDIKVGRRHQ
jgi:hypothetical protein